MAFFADLSQQTQVASGPRIRAVGWLGNSQSFPQGASPVSFVRRLRLFTKRWYFSTKELWWGIFRGLHTCEICGQADGFGNIGVPNDSLLWVAPAMISHYVETHHYLPPQKFVRAVLQSALPGTAEYRAKARPFRLLYGRAISPNEYRFFKKEHPRFPGIRRCIEWMRKKEGPEEILKWELYDHARQNPHELLDGYRTEMDHVIKFKLLWVIGEARIPAAFPDLKQALLSSQDLIRRFAAVGLRFLDSPKAKAALRKAGLPLVTSFTSALFPSMAETIR